MQRVSRFLIGCILQGMEPVSQKKINTQPWHLKHEYLLLLLAVVSAIIWFYKQYHLPLVEYRIHCSDSPEQSPGNMLQTAAQVLNKHFL